MQTNDFSNLPTSWQIKTLGEVCVSTNSNITFKNIQDKKGDYPIYGASGVVAYVDFYTKENQSLGIVKDGAGIGRVFLLPPKASVIGTLHYVENNDNLNLKYLFYFLQSINLARYITGSAIPHIYFRDWKKEQIPLPPLEIQKRIVARLESAFEKIEKGSAHLQDAKTKLAKYKQSLLKSAFDGTLTAAASLRESAAEEAIHKVDCHDLTSSNLAMTDKENPKLPQGWTIKTLGEIGEIISGGTPSTKQADNFGGDIAWITPADLSNHNNKFISQGKRNISEKGLKNSSARLVPKGTILFSSRAPIGYVAIASNQLCTNQGFKNLIPNKNVSSEFVYYYLLNSKNLAESYASGTTFKEISAKSFSKLPIPLPPLETQKQIVKLLERHFECADKTDKFIESALNKAKQLKQSLLKSAFLGELTQ